MYSHEQIYMDRIRVHLVKYTPDRLFNYNTYFKSKYNVSNISVLYRYKSKQGLIVTLRAPKHFKVGRQQYNTYKSLVYVTINFLNEKRFTNNYIDSNNIANAIVCNSNSLLSSLPYTFISEQSCVKFSYSVQCKINI